MADQKVIHGAAISINPSDPQGTAASVSLTLMPIVLQAAAQFGSRKERAEFLATFACGFSGVYAAEFGFADAADLFDMVAKITRDAEAKVAGRPN